MKWLQCDYRELDRGICCRLVGRRLGFLGTLWSHRGRSDGPLVVGRGLD